MTRVSENLKAQNTRLRTAICLTKDLSDMDELPVIATDKVDTKLRGKPTVVVATFCPFCGTRYPRKDDQP